MKRIIIVALVLCLCSCSTITEKIIEFVDNNIYNTIPDLEKASFDDYVDVLRQYHVRDKNINNTKDNEEFNKFLHDVVIDIYEDSYISVHYDFVDYKSFGIEKPEVTWGEIEEDEEEKIQKHIEQLNTLHNFNYSSLSYRQQFDYEALEYSLYEDLVTLTVDFDDVLLFDSRHDLLSNIIDQLSDFTFYDKESVDDYMILLADCDRYLDDAIEYTEKVAKERGYYLVDASIDIAEEYIDSFVGAKPNALVSTFNERIDKLDFIDKKEKSKYKEENKKIVNEEIIPVCKKVRDTVESHRGMTTTDDNRLVRLSKELAEKTYLLDISCNEPIDNIFNNGCYILSQLVNEVIPLYHDDTVTNDLERIKAGDVYPLSEDFPSMLDFLQDNYTKTNPDLGVINYELSSIDASSASSSVTAYYWPAPIDKPEQNVIKYNPNLINDGENWESYFTISHEGIPGHMYDFYRLLLNKNNEIRRVISFVGVTEGYAMYSEICASSYLDVDEKTQRYLAIESVSGYIFDGIVDIAINYYDYSDDELIELINSLGYNVKNLEGLKNFFANNYGTLTRYGMGLANILCIKEEVQNKLGDAFDEVEFNDLLTRNGTLPLVVIDNEINKYIEAKLQ